MLKNLTVQWKNPNLEDWISQYKFNFSEVLQFI